MKNKVDLHAKIESKNSLTGASHSLGAYAGLVFVALLFAGGWLVGMKSHSKEAVTQMRTAFLNEFKSALAQHGVLADVVADEGVLRISTQNVLFPVGKENVPADQLKAVDAVTAVLQKALSCNVPQALAAHDIKNALQFETQPCEQPTNIEFNCDGAAKHLAWNAVLLQGHADARPIVKSKHYADNLALSAARSQSLMRRMYQCTPTLAAALNEQGLPLLNTAAYSTQRPANVQDNLSDENRRMELRFVVKGL